MTVHTVDVSIRGTWHTVPALEVDGRVLAVKGTWLKIAVIKDEEYIDETLRDPSACIESLKQQRRHGFAADVFTFAQRLPETTPNFAYPMERDSIAAVRTTSFDTWWSNLPQEGRKNVRRAGKRGVNVEVRALDDNLIKDIVELNNDSPMRQGKRFVHYGKTFDEVKKDQTHLAERSDYVCAYVGAELIGFIKVAYGGNVASIIQILPKASHHDKRPANALLASTIELCQAKGKDYLTYGRFQEGNRKESPLRQFKIRNGFEEILVPRFYVPLTSWGHIGVQTRLYRGLIGFLPDALIELGVNARAKWYGTSQSSGTPV